MQALLLCLLIINARSNKSARFIIQFYAIVVAVMFLLSLQAISHRGLTNVLMQIFVHTKYILFVSMFFVFLGVERVRALVSVFVAISIFFLFFDLLFPGILHGIFDIKQQIRGNSIRPIGIQAHTAPLGFLFSMFSIYILFFTKRRDAFWYALFAVCIVLVFLTSVRTALMAFPVILMWLFKDSLKHASFALFFIIPALIFFSKTKYAEELVYITQENILVSIENPQENAYIRGMMLYFSFELANENFPTGTGAATFGTVRSDDSDVYAYLGVQNSRFFIEKDGIYDSNFASVLGEFGYLGMALYYISFVMFITSKKILPGGYRFGVGSVPLLLVFLFYSFTNPVFMNTSQVIIFLMFYFASLEKIPIAVSKAATVIAHKEEILYNADK
ncbi:O-antigen ligase family protein [Pseudoalteromonas pernae]|uniref:O-antigen ligase family protein n=1 Tax=Pseudoalteromonas pernae TaxID=3118054 RepID=UPI003242223D